MTSANTVKIRLTASTQRLRMRSRNSLVAMVRMGANSMQQSLTGESEKYVFQRRFPHMQILHLWPERGDGGQHLHFLFAGAVYGDAVCTGANGQAGKLFQYALYHFHGIGSRFHCDGQWQAHLLAQLLHGAA